MSTQLPGLTELTTTSDNDLLLVREASTGVDKRMRAVNLRAKATTKADVGLGNVDNTSDLNKPISTATQTALNAKVTGPASATNNHLPLFDGTTGKLIKGAGKGVPAGAIVGTTDTQTLTNKTLTSPAISGGTVNNASIGATTPNTGAFTTLTASSTVTLNGTTIPASATLVTTAATQTLTNKTINLASNTLVATSAQIAAAVTNETGSGLLVFNTSPTLTTPVINTSITGTAVTQTSIDTTTGRLLKVGDFGVGQIDTSNTSLQQAYDWDNPLDFRGGYFVRNGNVNPPPGITFPTGFVIGNARLMVASRSNRVFIRDLSAALPWEELYHTGNLLGTVSQSAGVPTGAVIQRGSNANGEFVRFADGTLICTHTLTASSSASATWTFPSVFAAAPSFSGTAVATVSSVVTLDIATTTTAATFSARGANDARRADSVSLIAVGRWF
jgi:hypothetical protein